MDMRRQLCRRHGLPRNALQVGLLLTVAGLAPIAAPVAVWVAWAATNPTTAGGYVAAPQLRATPKDAVGTPLTGWVVAWTSGAPAAGTAIPSGVATGVRAGAATIMATSEGKSGSAGVTRTTPPQPPTLTTASPPPPGVLFASDWSYATGNSDAALRDGTKWDVALVGGTQALNPDETVVVNTTAPPGVANSLRLQQQGSRPHGWSMVGKTNFTLPSRDYYLRYYFRNDDVAGTIQDHIVEPGPPAAGTGDYNELTYLNKAEYATGWRPRLVLGCKPAACPWAGSATMPNWDLGEAPGALAYGRWYRFEYWVHFTTPTRIQVHPRIYDDTGALLYGDANFIASPGYGVWPGATLASYYAGTNPKRGPTDFGITPSTLVHIQFGNNGSSAARNTGLYWYFAKVMIRSDAWPGP